MPRWISINDICLDSAQYPVKKPRTLKNGQIKVTFSIPVFHGKVTITCLPDELPKLAYGHLGFLGATIAWQCHVAERLLHPDGPQRKSTRNLIKWLASQDAKRLHPTIVYLHKHPEDHFHRYTQLVKAVSQTRLFKNGPPPREITAWLIEQLHPELGASNPWGLTPPTRDIEHFGKKYLYTPPRMKPCTLENLPERINELWQILHTEKISQKISNIEVRTPLQGQNRHKPLFRGITFFP